MRGFGHRLAALTAALTLCPAASVARAELMLNPTAHVSLAELGSDWGAGADLGVSFAWVPISELAVGLDMAVLLPLPTAQDERESELTLRVCPVVWLRFGEESAWAFVKAGAGVTTHRMEDGQWKSVMVAVIASGFVVAPTYLPFHFGFELHGELDLVGPVSTQVLGLGGFVGWMW